MYFKRSEFKCRCLECGGDTVDFELMDVLNELREYFNTPVFITSGFRCNDRNILVGGSPNSQHLTGKAADIVVQGITPEKIYRYLDQKYPDKYGMGNAKTFTHIDVRDNKARWAY